MRRPVLSDEGFDPELLGPAPLTYSYNDALLTGKMSRAELEAVRAEILDGAGLPRASDPGPQPIGAVELVRVRAGGGATPREMTELEAIHASLDADDYAAALERAEKLLERDPGCEEAAQCAEAARQMLGRVYLAELGDGGDRPRVLISEAEQRQAHLDRWAAFVVSCVDGVCSIEEVTEITGMPRIDTLRILYELVQKGVVRIERRPPPR